jgi:hypothetical protein
MGGTKAIATRVSGSPTANTTFLPLNRFTNLVWDDLSDASSGSNFMHDEEAELEQVG